MALPSDYQIRTLQEVDQVIPTLSDSDYDLVIFDNPILTEELSDIVHKIKQNNPLIQVVAWSDHRLQAQDNSHKAGIDDFLDRGISDDELAKRLQTTLSRKNQPQQLEHNMISLHHISQLTRQLHGSVDKESLILETVKQTCETFALPGMGIFLEGDAPRLHLYWTGKSVQEVTPTTDTLTALRKLTDMQSPQVYNEVPGDIASVMHISQHIDRPISMLALPFSTQNQEKGVFVFLDKETQTFHGSGLTVYEMLSDQFVIALNNLNAAKEISKPKSIPHPSILGAMQRFIALNTIEDVASTLYTLVENATTVKRAFVWLESGDTAPLIQMDIRQDASMALNQLKSRGLIQKHLLNEFKKTQGPITLQLEHGKQNPLGPLFRVMVDSPLIAFPIQVENGISGTVVVSGTASNGVSHDDQSFIEVLTYATEQALSHISVDTPKEGKKEDFEVLLESVSDAVFIVDEDQTVKFCNSRFTELTGITQDMVRNQSYTKLVDHLSEITQETEQVKAQAIQRIGDLFNGTPFADTVEIALQGDHQVELEFIAIGTERAGRRWAGFLREKSPVVYPTAATLNSAPLLDLILEQSRLPYTQMHSSITSLVEEHRHMTHRELNTFLRNLESDVDNVKRLWDTFRGIYNVETNSIQPVFEDTDLHELIDQVLGTRTFSRHYRRFQVNAPEKLPILKLDVPRIEQAFSNLLQSLIDLCPTDSPIAIDLKPVDGEVHFIAHSHSLSVGLDQINKLFEPLFWSNGHSDHSTAGFGLYLSKQLVQQQGGRIWAERSVDGGVQFTVTLPERASWNKPVPATSTSIPVMSDDQTRQTQAIATPASVNTTDPVEPTVKNTAAETPTRAPERALQTIMVIQGKSDRLSDWNEKLENEGYDLLVYDSPKVALSELSLTRFDLILLDASVNEDQAESLEICGWIRKQSEVPIIIVNEASSAEHQIEALKQGADDYIVQSISDEEFLARVKVIFKRQHIAARTREPLAVGDISIDFARREVALKGEPVKLTRIQYELLYTLAINRDQVLTHKQLLEKVWGPEYRGETQYLWVNISRLRKKLEPDPNSPCYIQNVPGIGYSFKY